MRNKYIFKGIRNALFGIFQLALPLPRPMVVVVCVVFFGTSIGWFYRAFGEANHDSAE